MGPNTELSVLMEQELQVALILMGPKSENRLLTGQVFQNSSV